MKTPKIFFGTVVLAMMGLAAVLLTGSRLRQHLGDPGVKTRPLSDGKMEILLPESLPGYQSEILTNAEAILVQLPPDTSYRVRLYKSEQDGFASQLSVVLMGTDRGSIHRPEACMFGQGWTVDDSVSRTETVDMTRPFKYKLTVNKLVCSKVVTDVKGKPQTIRGIYVFWFVDATHVTASQLQWMLWWMPRDLILHGDLERWAYISYFSPCLPGQEDATFDRMKELMALSVPEFQLVPRAGKPANKL